jgi:hypothetical protein
MLVSPAETLLGRSTTCTRQQQQQQQQLKPGTAQSDMITQQLTALC